MKQVENPAEDADADENARPSNDPVGAVKTLEQELQNDGVKKDDSCPVQ